jgi:hypothetical protein
LHTRKKRERDEENEQKKEIEKNNKSKSLFWERYFEGEDRT